MAANEAVVEAIAGKRPLIYDEYNLRDGSHKSTLFPFNKACCLGKFTSILRITWHKNLVI